MASIASNPSKMEKNNKLADLKLVAKHFPTSNFSYPRCDGAPLYTCEQDLCNAEDNYDGVFRGQTRPSRESSFSSIPSMVEDTGSDDDCMGEDELQYHVNAAEIWDSFWPPKDDQLYLKSPKYPALIKSPANVRARNARERNREKREQTICPLKDDGQTVKEWPLADPFDVRPKTSRAAGPKASYSLFPQQTAYEKRPTPAPAHTGSPRPKTSSGSGLPLQSVGASALNLPAGEKRTRPAPLILLPASTAHMPLSSSLLPPPSPAPILVPFYPTTTTRPEQNDTAKPWHRRPSFAKLSKFSLSKPHEPASYLELAQATSQSEAHLSTPTLYDEPISPMQPVPPLSRPVTPWGVPPRPLTPREQRPAAAAEAPPSPLPIFVPMPIPSRRAPQPPCISAFDDSDSESDGESRSFARRLLGGLAGHHHNHHNHHHHRADRDGKNHKRSASDGKDGASTGKGAVVRRARAETEGAAVHRPGEFSRQQYEEERGGERLKPRRQGGDVFGRMLGRKSR